MDFKIDVFKDNLIQIIPVFFINARAPKILMIFESSIHYF